MKKSGQTSRWSLNSYHGDETKDIRSTLCFLNHFTSHVKQEVPKSIMGLHAKGAKSGLS